MATDLVRRSAQLTTTGRFQRSGRLITRDLKKKERLTRRDKLWIYNDFIAIGICGSLFVASLIFILNASGEPALIGDISGATGVIAMIGLVLSLVLSSQRMNGRMDAHFDHTTRREIVRGERSRRMAPHASKRKSRERELDFNYTEYSVDVRYSEQSNAVTLTLLEHEPWKDGRYISKPLALSYEMIEKVEGSDLIVQDLTMGIVVIHPPTDSSDAVMRIADRVADVQAVMEIIADGLEEMEYDRKKARILTRRMALQVRR